MNTSNDKPLHNELSETSFGQNDITSLEETEISELEESSEAMAEVVIQRPVMPRIQPLVEQNITDFPLQK